MMEPDQEYVEPITPKVTRNITLLPVPGRNPITPLQGELSLRVHAATEIDGVGMGVLSDGTPFLTQRGLARLCGVSNPRISEIGADWGSEDPKPITARIRKILEDRGVPLPERPYIEIKLEGGIPFHAYPDVVCLAVLEYYAFDAGPSIKEQAQRNYRLLAGKTLHDFIYVQVGYKPNQNVAAMWQQYHDRVSLTYNAVPAGFFGIFKEIADMIVTLGEAGLHIDSSFVPDISVGGAWSKHWIDNSFDERYGARRRWKHNYPKTFPQSASNPQPAWCYPEVALGEFRRWFRDEYIGGGKFSTYINRQIRQKQLPPSFASMTTAAYNLDGRETNEEGDD